MINTHLKFEAKIPNGSKVVAFTRNYIKFLGLKAKLTLKVKSRHFSNTSEIFRRSMNSLSVKANSKYVNLKVKQIFCKFEGQFDIEDQGHKFLK